MAITIISSPDAVSSTKSDMIYDVISDSTDITTKIVAVIFYRRRLDLFWRIAGHKETNKRTGYNYFRFNIANMLDKVLSYEYLTEDTGIYTNIDSSCVYFVKFIEYYPSSAFAEEDSLLSGELYANNVSILKTETQGVYTGSTWFMDGVATHKFLTNSPSNVPIRLGERVQLGILSSLNPVVRVKKYFSVGSPTTDDYEIAADTTYTTYLWDYTINASETVTIETPELYTETNYIQSRSPSVTRLYMVDSVNKMWGGISLNALNDKVEWFIPTQITGHSNLSITINVTAIGGDVDFEVYYYILGVWTFSGSGFQTATVGAFSDFTEAIPADTTHIRIIKTGPAPDLIYIPYAFITSEYDSTQNRRAAFTLDTTEVTSTVTKLEIWAENTSSGVISEVKTFTVDNSLVENTSRFAFLNLRSDFDHFTFKQGHKESLLVDKIRVQNELPIGFTMADQSIKVAFVNSEIVFTSYTEYDTNEKLTWLKELVESKEVYLIVNDVRYAVDIITSTVDYSHHTSNLQFEIKWRFSSRRNV